MAANTASAVLVSSNPTNILITGSFGLNYLTGFTKWTVLPSVVPAVLNYGVIFFMFRKSIPKTIIPLQEDPWSKLRDRIGAVFLTTLMLVTVAVLVGTSFVPGHAVEVWMVTAPAGILAFMYNVISDWRDTNAGKRKVSGQKQDLAAEAETTDRTGSNISQQDAQLTNVGELRALPPPRSHQHELLPTKASPSPLRSPENEKPSSHKPNLLSLRAVFSSHFPSTTQTLARLPIPLLPFAMCEFIMVRGLAQRGWIHVFAHGFSHICTTPASTVFFLGFFTAAILCPLAGTNIGATIILVEILRDPAFTQSQAVLEDKRVLLGAVYSVALGSNLGAFSFTFAGSLAGLLWRGLLRDSKVGRVEVSQWRFAKVNALPLVVQTGVACAIIWGELYWFA